MTAPRQQTAGPGRSTLRRFVSVITDLALAVIFVGLWLLVITRGEELSLWP